MFCSNQAKRACYIKNQRWCGIFGVLLFCSNHARKAYIRLKIKDDAVFFSWIAPVFVFKIMQGKKAY
jgi:hypothetical protein